MCYNVITPSMDLVWLSFPFPGKKQVVIGASPENYIKCVADPGHVKCDNTAKQLGRTGEYPDSFHIYHKGTEHLGQLQGMLCNN